MRKGYLHTLYKIDEKIFIKRSKMLKTYENEFNSIEYHSLGLYDNHVSDIKTFLRHEGGYINEKGF